MAIFNVEIRQRIGGIFGDIVYPKTSWDLVQNKPSTFTATAHSHQGKDISDANPSYFINNASVVTTGSWAATLAGVDSLYDGLFVHFKLPGAGNSTCYLNINGLGAKIIYRYSTSKLTTHFNTNYVIPLIYDSVLNGGCWVISSDNYYSAEDYNMCWENSLQFGRVVSPANDPTTIYNYGSKGYHLCMQGVDGKIYAVTTGGDAPATNNVVTDAELLINGLMLYYGTSADAATDEVLGSSYWYEGEYSGEMEYWSNKASGWAVAYRPFYIVGTLNANGRLILEGAGTVSSSFITQTLPTTDDGKLYIQVGYMNNTYDAWRLQITHPIYQFKDGKLRLYVPEHKHVKADITDFPTSLPASDVYAWAKAASKPSYAWSEIGSKPTTFAPIIGSGAADAVAGNDARLTNSRPASDVYAWAKAASKPSYNASEIGGLGASYRWLTDAYISAWNAKPNVSYNTVSKSNVAYSLSGSTLTITFS